MDVERIQKINNMALDLLKQGLAQNREEAVAQAEKMFRGSETENYNSMRETLQEVEAQKKGETQEDPQSTVVEDLSQEKVKDILAQNTNFLVRRIKEFEEKVDAMAKEISSLKTKMARSQLQTAGSIVSQSSAAKEAPQVEQQAQTAPSAPPAATQDASKDHPRSGNYNDTDVSIEKFFYMGSK